MKTPSHPAPRGACRRLRLSLDTLGQGRQRDRGPPPRPGRVRRARAATTISPSTIATPAARASWKAATAARGAPARRAATSIASAWRTAAGGASGAARRRNDAGAHAARRHRRDGAGRRRARLCGQPPALRFAARRDRARRPQFRRGARRRPVHADRPERPAPQRCGFSRQADAGQFRLHQLSRHLPARPGADDRRDRAPRPAGRQRAAGLHHRRSGARHARRAQGLMSRISPTALSA